MPGGKDVSIVTRNRCARGLRCVYCNQEHVCRGLRCVNYNQEQVCPGVKMCQL